MHGVKRAPKTAASAEARATRKAKEAAKLQGYLEIERLFFTYKKEGRKDAEALEHTTRLLTLNPELYTVWNYRREILLHIFSSPSDKADGVKPDVFAALRVDDSGPAGTKGASAEAGEKPDQFSEEQKQRNRNLLEDDLQLTEHALRAHPKVYWIWNHRMWCLQQYPAPSSSSSTSSTSWVWERELKLVEKMLELDPRNFHGWNCRRSITTELAYTILSSHSGTSSLLQSQPSFPTVLSEPVVIETAEVKNELLKLADRELAYTLRKIESNFSNFSAWHQRSKLLPHIWTARGLSQAQIDTKVDEELEMIKQAMYTDPSDQSVWFYHRWLIDLLLAEGGVDRRERRVKVLQQEVEGIEELFELEPESKWCAMSLAHLQTVLAEEYKGKEGKEEEFIGKVKALLLMLIDLDPDRKARYEDLLEGKAHF